MSEPVHEDNVYHFKGLPLTPSAMREILKLIYAAGERFNRAEAIRRVIDFHASNGGGEFSGQRQLANEESTSDDGRCGRG